MGIKKKWANKNYKKYVSFIKYRGIEFNYRDFLKCSANYFADSKVLQGKVLRSVTSGYMHASNFSNFLRIMEFKLLYLMQSRYLIRTSQVYIFYLL